MSNQPYAIGVDIGGTSTKFGIVNNKAAIIYAGSIPTQEFLSPANFVDALYQGLLPGIHQVGEEKIKGIGVGAPNGNYYTGTVDYAPNLPWKNAAPLAGMIERTFKLPCVLTNDANAAAVGEMIYGAAKGMKNFIMLTLGTGVGSGIVANGQLVYGHDGFAGELGHIVVRKGRKHWATGFDGPLEAYVSATGIAITAKVLLDTCVEPSLLRNFNLDQIDSRVVSECAMQGDRLAQQVFAYTGEVLGEALANFIMFSSPEAIVLFGGVTKAGDLLMRPTQEHMEKNLLPIYRNKVKLLFSKLKESDAAILGSSALVWEMKKQNQLIEL